MAKWTDSGRLFQRNGAQQWKALAPVLVLTLGTDRLLLYKGCPLMSFPLQPQNCTTFVLDKLVLQNEPAGYSLPMWTVGSLAHHCTYSGTPYTQHSLPCILLLQATLCYECPYCMEMWRALVRVQSLGCSPRYRILVHPVEWTVNRNVTRPTALTLLTYSRNWWTNDFRWERSLGMPVQFTVE